MRRRFPLYARILLWFFLNLLVVVLVLAVAFRVQFRLGLDWLLAGGAADRIESVSYLMLLELSDRPRAEWNAILERFSHAYQIQFSAFGREGQQLAGQALQLPPAVKARLLEGMRPPPHLSPPEFPSAPGQAAREALDPRVPSADGPPNAPPPVRPPRHLRHPKAIVRTTDPTRYWVLVRGELHLPQLPPRPITLVALSTSLRGGGLLFDSKPWLTAGFGVLLLSALLWLPLVRGITRSIARMTRATEQIAGGDFDVRVGSTRADELGSLGAAIDQMAVRLAGLVGGQNRFLGDIAHELCSPLARLQVALGILEQRAGEELQPYIKAACDKAQLMSALVNELLSFSKASLVRTSMAVGPVAVREIVDAVVAREGHENVQVHVADDLRVQADPQLLTRALSNLLRNAIRYAGEAGPITIAAHQDQAEVSIEVADCGPGVPEEHLSRLFDPFYRVDTSRDRATGGVGLGLTIVKTCIEACRGSVVCHNRKPTGFEVIVRLPGV